jgi:lipoyl(octanoyl) transferase
VKPIEVCWLGRVDYRQALDLQTELVAARRDDLIGDQLVLLEHPPVITLGRNSRRENLLQDEATLADAGVELHEAGRGGDVTYHGPGQLVGYPLLKLEGDERDAHVYLRHLEQGLIDCAARYGIVADRQPGLTGIWVGLEKLAAIGVRLSTGWITSHGFALNVSTDLSGFSRIVPCGIQDRGVTSLERLLATPPSLEEAAEVASEVVSAAICRTPTALRRAPSWSDVVSWPRIAEGQGEQQ